MRKLAVSGAVALIAAIAFASSASAGSGWAGSRYAKSDCHQIGDSSRPGLRCEATFTTTAQATETRLIADASCLGGGLRAIERSGTRQTSFDGFDIYNGPVPLAKFNVGGDESNFVDTWLDFTDTDLGCI